MATLLRSDLAQADANDFGAWADQLHASDPPIPNPFEALGNLGTAVEEKKSDFLNWAEGLNQPPLATPAPTPVQPAPAPAAAQSPISPTQISDSGAAVTQPAAPSPFLDWASSVDRGIAPFEITPPPQPAETPAPPSPVGRGSPAPNATDAVPLDTTAGRVFPVQGYGGQVDYHWGDVKGGSDLFAPRGTPVVAMEPGKVVESGWNDVGGNAVLIQGQDGNQYYYAHLDQTPSVKVGQQVDAGTFLGPVGDTGDAKGRGTHLHIGIGPDIKLGADKYGGTGGDYDAVSLLRSTLAPSDQRLAGGERPATQTTAELSGGGANTGGLNDRARQIMGAAADTASWLGDQGQKALQAILVTEGGLSGARGDNGQSAGPLQFFEEGQLANFARQTGQSLEQAKTYVEQRPGEAIQWAIGTPDNPGYLGKAILNGIQQNLSGPDLATYAQRTGQVSVSPERAGQNWQALFGTGTGVLQGPSDVLGASQALLSQTAQNIGSGAAQRVQDTSGALTDWMLERQRQASEAVTGFRAPETLTSPFQRAQDLQRQIEEAGIITPGTTAPQIDWSKPIGPQIGYDIAGGLGRGAADIAAGIQQGDVGRALGGAFEAGSTLASVLPGPGEAALARLGPSLAEQAVTSPAVQAALRARQPAQAAFPEFLQGAEAAAEPAAARPVGRLADALNKGIAFTTSNILSAPASLFTNATALARNVTRPLESAATAAYKAVGGDVPGARTELGAAGADLLGQGAAFGDALADFGRTFVRGRERPGVDIRAEAWPGPAGMLATTALRLNAATDELVRGLASAGAQAAEHVRLQGQNPGVDAAEIARRFGDRLSQVGAEEAAHAGLETGGTGLGDVISRWRGQLTRQGATVPERLAGAALQVAVPFSKVPDVLLTRGARRVPGLNEVLTAKDVYSAARAGDMDAMERAMARYFISSATNLGIWALVQQGMITGAGPDDPARKRALMEARDASGNPLWRPNSIKIGDRWFQYGGLGPISVQLGAIANGVEQWELEGRKLTPNMVGAIGRATADTVTDFWYLQTISDIFQAAKTGSLGGVAGRTFGSVEDRLVPESGLLNQIRQWRDSTLRDPDNPLAREANRLPWLSELVRPRIDPATGQPMQEPRDISAAFIRSTAPGLPDPVNEALAQRGMGVPDAPDTITRGSGTIQLTDDEKRQFLELSGPEVARRVESVIGAPGYDQLPPDQQAARLQRAVSSGRDAGEGKLWATIPGQDRQRRVLEYREAQRQQRGQPAVILGE